MRTSPLLTPIACVALAGAAQAQIFVDNQTLIPSGSPDNNSYSENIDFGDVDDDGDWDAVFADGGDLGNDQNRIWINGGGAQGGLVGVFIDQTSSRFPSVQDDSRDIEFADIDNDRDLDIYVSNTAQITNQGNKWWVNQGGTQGGSIGFFNDETAARWINLGASGSSVSPGALINGSFIDWSCDCDFGDLDNDGDLDLVHSSYGGAFSGDVPTRIFLNDGSGRFEEFNPSGFQLTGSNINDGNPALWCEGVQQSNTVDATGAEADIASSALDIDVGDIDGDFDLDILHGARQELPRMFVNRLEENGGTLGFRDVTGAVFPAGYSTGDGHYEQEMGDLDGDGDLDIYGLNWDAGGFSFDDLTFRNDGAGNFTLIQTLSNSSNDDNEGDFFDWDCDGDLDLFVANFTGSSRVYENDGTGTLNFVSGATSGFGSIANFIALDADACDVDNDGDYDVFQSNDVGSRNQYFQNQTNVPDTSAPYIPNVENPGTVVAGNGQRALRAQVYDNAPYYITWYNDTTLQFGVNGFDIGSRLAVSSGGQVFRAQIPAQLVGSVEVTWTSSDEYGNTGSSTPVTFTATAPSPHQSIYGVATPDALGTTPTAEMLSLAKPGKAAFFGLTGPANAAYIFAVAPAPQVPPLPLGLGTVHVDRNTVDLSITGALDGNGQDVFVTSVPGSFTPGDSLFFQLVTIAPNPPSTPAVGLSSGLEMIVQ